MKRDNKLQCEMSIRMHALIMPNSSKIMPPKCVLPIHTNKLLHLVSTVGTGAQCALFWAITQLSPPNRFSQKGTKQHFLMRNGWFMVFPDGTWMDECGTGGGGLQQHHESPPSHLPHIVCVGNGGVFVPRATFPTCLPIRG